MPISEKTHDVLVGLHDWATTGLGGTDEASGTHATRPPVRISWSDVAPRMLLNMQQHGPEYRTREEVLDELVSRGEIDAAEATLVRSMLQDRNATTPVSVWTQTLILEIPYRLRHLIFVLAWCDAIVAVGRAVEFFVGGHGGDGSGLTAESITSMLYQMVWPDFSDRPRKFFDAGFSQGGEMEDGSGAGN